MCEHPFSFRGEPQTGLMSSCHAYRSLSNMRQVSSFKTEPRKLCCVKVVSVRIIYTLLFTLNDKPASNYMITPPPPPFEIFIKSQPQSSSQNVVIIICACTCSGHSAEPNIWKKFGLAYLLQNTFCIKHNLFTI